MNLFLSLLFFFHLISAVKAQDVKDIANPDYKSLLADVIAKKKILNEQLHQRILKDLDSISKAKNKDKAWIHAYKIITINAKISYSNPKDWDLVEKEVLDLEKKAILYKIKISHKKIHEVIESTEKNLTDNNDPRFSEALWKLNSKLTVFMSNEKAAIEVWKNLVDAQLNQGKFEKTNETFFLWLVNAKKFSKLKSEALFARGQRALLEENEKLFVSSTNLFFAETKEKNNFKVKLRLAQIDLKSRNYLSCETSLKEALKMTKITKQRKHILFLKNELSLCLMYNKKISEAEKISGENVKEFLNDKNQSHAIAALRTQLEIQIFKNQKKEALDTCVQISNLKFGQKKYLKLQISSICSALQAVNSDFKIKLINDFVGLDDSSEQVKLLKDFVETVEKRNLKEIKNSGLNISKKIGPNSLLSKTIALIK